ncbi:coiled-coil domain-containing protein 122 [Varanus komodoensis]|uniref:Coiled-coil domain containing 122 n=1 Tax=Varanus komodoensis TaxID=61221 RepID=A0A8D2L9Q6_VARKO|nr:coiled-coil domain-containing protein 122 [Varanus komodoensis]
MLSVFSPLAMASPSSPSLTEVVKRVAEQQNSQAAEIETGKALLAELQTQLQELEFQMNCVDSERKAIEREIYHQDESTASLKDRCEKLGRQSAGLSAENVKLRFDAQTLEEEFKGMLRRNRAYYEKIAAHKDRFVEVESKLPLMTELSKKRAAVKEMILQKEALVSSLRNPDVLSASPVQEEIACLQGEIHALKEAVHEKEKALRDERSMHAQLQKEIEVQNKRCEAMLKRLQCQVNKRQANKRRWCWNI